jgi:hypothetical protein
MAPMTRRMAEIHARVNANTSSVTGQPMRVGAGTAQGHARSAANAKGHPAANSRVKRTGTSSPTSSVVANMARVNGNRELERAAQAEACEKAQHTANMTCARAGVSLAVCAITLETPGAPFRCAMAGFSTYSCVAAQARAYSACKQNTPK